LGLIIAGHRQPAAQHIDGLIGFIMRVRDGPGEMSRDDELHGREPGRPVLMTGKDVDRLSGIPEGQGIPAMSQERHEPLYARSPVPPRARNPRRHPQLPLVARCPHTAVPAIGAEVGTGRGHVAPP
jgi:hypothetical protein